MIEMRQKFTQKERDLETGFDYFGARYYGSTQGRFSSPDPLYASGRPLSPQSWNRYTYVLNKPLSLTDPSGMIWGTQDFEQDGHKYRRYKWFHGDKVGNGYTAFTPDQDGTVLPLVGGGGARIYRNGHQETWPGPRGDGKFNNDSLNLTAGHLHGIARALTGGTPLGEAAVDVAFSQIGGVDPHSELYKKGDIIGASVTAGVLAFIVPPTRPDPEYVNLTKQIASESGVAQVLAGEGKAFAGAGTEEIFRDAANVAEEHGGQASEWAKVSSDAFHAADGATIETYAVQNVTNGKVVNLKSVSSSFPGRRN